MYYTTMVRLPATKVLEWYIEEIDVSNALFYILKKWNLIFITREDCKADILTKISKKGGIFLESLPDRGIYNKLRM